MEENNENSLKKYISLFKQAENIDSPESYKELMEIFDSMEYGELHDILQDCSLVLKSIVRNGCQVKHLRYAIEEIQKLCEGLLKFTDVGFSLYDQYRVKKK